MKVAELPANVFVVLQPCFVLAFLILVALLSLHPWIFLGSCQCPLTVAKGLPKSCPCLLEAHLAFPPLSSEDLLPLLPELFDHNPPSLVTDSGACLWLSMQLYRVAELLGLSVSFPRLLWEIRN